MREGRFLDWADKPEGEKQSLSALQEMAEK
jgi:hypothetical protein